MTQSFNNRPSHDVWPVRLNWPFPGTPSEQHFFINPWWPLRALHDGLLVSCFLPPNATSHIQGDAVRLVKSVRASGQAHIQQSISCRNRRSPALTDKHSFHMSSTLAEALLTRNRARETEGGQGKANKTRNTLVLMWRAEFNMTKHLYLRRRRRKTPLHARAAVDIPRVSGWDALWGTNFTFSGKAASTI